MEKKSLHLSISSLILIVVITLMGIGPIKPAGEKPFLGRWDIDVKGDTYDFVSSRHRFCWLELKLEDGVLKGRLQPGEGATVNLTDITIENGQLTFQYNMGRTPNQRTAKWTGTVKGKQLEGTVNSPIFGKERTWTAVRAPVWPSKTPKRKPGKPVNLIGNDVSNWDVQYPNVPIGWHVEDGILRNVGKQANNIYTKQKFQDFKLEAEFRIEPKSNSGIYLRGRYEIQVMDNYGATMNTHSMGALYGYIAPSVNACKPAEEWQTYEITLIANRVTVILNGIKVIDNGEVPGITGDALNARENEPGPIMIQGNHGPVHFRKLVLTPLL
jgi:hypothetical protein